MKKARGDWLLDEESRTPQGFTFCLSKETGAKEAAEKTFVRCAPLRYALAFGRAELFIFDSLVARINPCPDTSSRP